MAVLLVLTTISDKRSARRLAEKLVRNKLAACVSLKDGFNSFYSWKGRLKRSTETLLLVKTTTGRFPSLERFIKSNHVYQLPEIIGLPVARASREYLTWVRESLK